MMEQVQGEATCEGEKLFVAMLAKWNRQGSHEARVFTVKCHNSIAAFLLYEQARARREGKNNVLIRWIDSHLPEAEKMICGALGMY